MAQETIYARANPRRIRLSETYPYQTRISGSSNTQPGNQPTGTVEITVAYDGHQSFGQLAVNDVKQQLKADTTNDARAVIGHLAVAGYERTDLDALLDLNARPSSTIPVEVPIRDGESGLAQIDDLGADRHLCILSQGYRPEWPECLPLHVSMELIDEQTVHEMAEGEGMNVWEVVGQQTGFQESLLLTFRVQLALPDRLFCPQVEEGTREKRPAPEAAPQTTTRTPAQAEPQPAALPEAAAAGSASEKAPEQQQPPRLAAPAALETPQSPASSVRSGEVQQPAAQSQPTIPLAPRPILTGEKEQVAAVHPRLARMSMQWPAAISHHSVRLLVGDDSAAYPLAYEPEHGMITWEGLELTYAGKAEGTDLHWFNAPPMTLWIDQPGELYRISRLIGSVEVEVPEVLLSGLQARYFGARGTSTTAIPTEIGTTIRSAVTIIPEERFQRRVFSPYQRLDFAGVVLNEMRLADIRTILQDHRFRDIQTQQLTRDNDRAAHLINGTRIEGANSLTLWIYATGDFVTTERRTIIPGGREFLTPVRTGDMVIHLRGELEGNSERLSGILNQIHRALKARFRHVVVE